MQRAAPVTVSTQTKVGNEIAKDLTGRFRICPLCAGTETFNFLSAPDRFHWRKEVYHLKRCSSCRFVWLVSPPKPEEMCCHYDADYYKTIATAGETSAPKRWQKQRARISRYKQKGTILDIGCSSGGFLGTMKREGWKLYGIEIAAIMAERARSRTGAEVFVGDALDAPFPPQSFDVVTCFDVLEHLNQPRQFLAKVLEWLKSGGVFYTMLPNIDSWEARLLGSYWYGLELPRHLYHFSPQSLRRLMNALGFQELCLSTERESYLEHSIYYVYADLLQWLGFSSVPLAKAQPASLPWKVIRKALRLMLVVPFGQVASLTNAGASIQAIFTKAVTHS
jgi:SAM-dependent methyltransferase